MASSLNKKNQKKVKKMSDPQLAALIEKLEPRVKMDSSLLDCAKWEYRRRTKRKIQLEDEEE